ncbi:MAG: hypothetical protein AAFP69_22715, partial [Planctomycetota bacterium]
MGRRRKVRTNHERSETNAGVAVENPGPPDRRSGSWVHGWDRAHWFLAACAFWFFIALFWPADSVMLQRGGAIWWCGGVIATMGLFAVHHIGMLAGAAAQNIAGGNSPTCDDASQKSATAGSADSVRGRTLSIVLDAALLGTAIWMAISTGALVLAGNGDGRAAVDSFWIWPAAALTLWTGRRLLAKARVCDRE